MVLFYDEDGTPETEVERNIRGGRERLDAVVRGTAEILLDKGEPWSDENPVPCIRLAAVVAILDWRKVAGESTTRKKLKAATSEDDTAPFMLQSKDSINGKTEVYIMFKDRDPRADKWAAEYRKRRNGGRG